jgi:ribonuclease HI
VEIRSDSQYVVDGFNENRHKWRRRAWYSTPTMAKVIKHADLWHRADRLLQWGERGQARFVKVKGYAKKADTARGKVREEDAWGNAAADYLARVGSGLTRNPVEW